MESAHTSDNPEALTQPSFLEIYGEQELTMFGKTGPLKQLLEWCPIPPDDPRMTPEATNAVVVKAMNASGCEVEAEHAEQFSAVLSKAGIEQKFKVASPEPSTELKKHPKPAAPASPDITTGPREAVPLRSEHNRLAAMAVAESQLVSPVIPPPIALQAARAHYEAVTNSLPEVTGSVISPATKVENIAGEPVLSTELPAPVQPAPMSSLETFDASMVPETPVAATTLPVPVPDVEVAYIETDSLENSFEVPVIIETAASTELLEIPEPDFVEAARDFSELLSSGIAINEDKPATQQEIDVAPITVTVLEKLTHLEPIEQETVAPVLQEIVSVVQELQLLSELGLGPEMTPLATEKLEELCVTLLESLNIPYEEQAVQEFVRLLLHNDVSQSSPMSRLLAADPYDMMHEKKVATNQATSLTAIGSRFHRLLGMFALRPTVVSAP